MVCECGGGVPVCVVCECGGGVPVCVVSVGVGCQCVSVCEWRVCA